MKMLYIILSALTAMVIGNHRRQGIYKGRAFTTDVAFKYRMGAGFAGDVNRSHPASIEPCLIDGSAPPTAFGLPVVVDPATEGVRPIVSGDSALTTCYGVTVRPFPFQADSATNYGATGIGSASPALKQPIDVLRSGYIKVVLHGASAAVKGGRVFIWYAASSGNHVQGGFEAAATTGSTIMLPINTTFNGGADADGNVELIFNI